MSEYPSSLPPSPQLKVVDGRLSLHMGTQIWRGADLKGSQIKLQLDSGQEIEIRLSNHMSIALPQGGELDLYQLDFRTNQTGQENWQALCQPDHQGRQYGLLLAVPESSHLRPSCSSGAEVKCILFGYNPWGQKDGHSLAPYHQACMQALHAAFCGDENMYTRDGTLIDLYDRIGIRQAEPDLPNFHFEAGWRTKGAICIHHSRLNDLFSLEKILQQCPHLAATARAICTEDYAKQSNEVLIFTRSAFKAGTAILE